MASIWEELKRRNVVKVAVAYAIVGWLLIQIVATVLPVFEAPDWIARVFTFFAVLGFPVALVIAWAYELTPDGIERTISVAASESIARKTGRKLELVTVGALILALVFVVYNYVLVAPEPEAAIADTATPVVEATAENAALTPADDAGGVLPNSVAVLLCDNLSPNPDDAYFAASIHEEILNQLVKISSLNVIARTSVLQYAEDPLPIPDVARELNVGAVMECSVRFAGTAIMVTAQLIDPETNSHLWSDTYPGDLSDLSAVFEMQADIAMNIANALRAEFSLAEQERLGKQATVSAEAYTVYLKAINADNGSGRMQLLNEAIALDSEFALAYAVRARTLAGWMRFGLGRRTEMEQGVIDNAETALSIDPDLVEARLALAAVHELNWQRVAADKAYREAFELNPNDPTVANAFAGFKRSAGEYPEAIRLGQIAVRLDPNTRNLWHQLGVTYLHAKDSDAAFRALQNALALEPDHPASTSELGRYYFAQGDLAAATEALLAIDGAFDGSGVPVLFAWRALDYERVGLHADAERHFARVEELVGASSTGNLSLATAYIAIHEYDKAYDEIERAIDGEGSLETNAAIELKVNRWEHPVLNEPRFVELRDKLGFQD
jgi:TolB-like protein